jgi:hypothetical protein
LQPTVKKIAAKMGGERAGGPKNSFQDCASRVRTAQDDL